MTSITTLFKELILICCSLIQTVYVMKSNQKIFMKNFLNINTFFDFSQHRLEFFDKTNKNVAGKMKDVHKGKQSLNLFKSLAQQKE